MRLPSFSVLQKPPIPGGLCSTNAASINIILWLRRAWEPGQLVRGGRLVKMHSFRLAGALPVYLAEENSLSLVTAAPMPPIRKTCPRLCRAWEPGQLVRVGRLVKMHSFRLAEALPFYLAGEISLPPATAAVMPGVGARPAS